MRNTILIEVRGNDGVDKHKHAMSMVRKRGYTVLGSRYATDSEGKSIRGRHGDLVVEVEVAEKVEDPVDALLSHAHEQRQHAPGPTQGTRGTS